MQLFEPTMCSPKFTIKHKHLNLSLRCQYNVRLFQHISWKIFLTFEILCWGNIDDVIWTHSDDIIKVVEYLKRIYDAVIMIVKLMILLEKAELRINPRTRLYFLWGKTASLYTGGKHVWLSNIYGICKQLLNNESEKYSRKFHFRTVWWIRW